ncbi:hypothetical protein BOX15_Mlig026295g1 [Macrostomum lignano]|uniref:SRCR domain-containing protein n=1 Tax=Macrostomum lignano TaxID=282301 RepID=A0A267GL45_9PLAT|nr:hypothetical protein BOX15_Mlig021641g1 [Macrostomum lignano]PAA86746.1 hypothetical protein BOX15_Mlig026295g1 [Macrostomum lignano]
MPPCLLLLLLLLLPLLLSAAVVNFYLLPAGHPRCRGAASRLRCLDQSLLLGADANPDETLLDAFLLCNNSWAALGCQRDDVGRLAWRLAFRLSGVPCGHRFVLASASASPLLGQSLVGSPPDRLAEFTCRSHAYPVVYRPRYRFTSLTWHRTAPDRPGKGSDGASVALSPSPPSPASSPFVTRISVHVYAEFRADVSTAAERAFLCESRGGFWCGGGSSLECVYSTHRCNGLDDCFNSNRGSNSSGTRRSNSTSLISSDEADCRYDNGEASGLFSDGIWRPNRSAVLSGCPACLLLALAALCSSLQSALLTLE